MYLDTVPRRTRTHYTRSVRNAKSCGCCNNVGRGGAEGNDVTHARLAEPVAAALGARVEVAVGTNLNLVHLQQTHSTLPVQSPRYDSQCTSTCTCNRKCTRTCTSMCMFMYANYA